MDNYDKQLLRSLEEHILGAVLMCDSDSVRGLILQHSLLPTDFTYKHHQELFLAMQNCWKKGNKVDIVIINAYKNGGFKDDDDERIWNINNADLAEKFMSVANLDQYILKFKEFRFIRFWNKMSDSIKELNWRNADIFEVNETIVAKYQQLFDRMTKNIKKSSEDDFISEMNTRYLNVQSGAPIYTTAGTPNFDGLLKGGLVNGELTIIAGRPGTLKTTIALIMGWNATSSQNKKVAFFSLEMPENQLKGKIVAGITGIDYDKIRSGHFDVNELQQITQAGKQIDKSGFSVFAGKEYKTIQQILRKTREMCEQGKCDIMFLDYIQRVKFKANTTREGVTDITRELKSIATDNNIPVVALSQLNRSVDGRDNKRPVLNDLKESSSIEEDADTVLFPYREAYYILKGDPQAQMHASEKWKVEMNIGKGRDIGMGGITLFINPVKFVMEDYCLNL